MLTFKLLMGLNYGVEGVNTEIVFFLNVILKQKKAKPSQESSVSCGFSTVSRVLHNREKGKCGCLYYRQPI